MSGTGGSIYRGLSNGNGEKRVEVLDAPAAGSSRPEQAEPDGSGRFSVIQDLEDLGRSTGAGRVLEHPSGPARYDWPYANEGSLRLAEALLHDAAGPALAAGYSEEFWAEWVSELRVLVRVVDDFWRFANDEGASELLTHLIREGRSRPRPEDFHAIAPRLAPEPPTVSFVPAGAEGAAEGLHAALTEGYSEDWRADAEQVRGWAQRRARLHAAARGVLVAGGGVLLLDLYGPLSRRVREAVPQAGREDDLVVLGSGWEQPASFNLLERPSWLEPRELARLVAGAVAESEGWEARPDDEEEEPLSAGDWFLEADWIGNGADWEEVATAALLEDALLALILANDALKRRGEPARYTLLDLGGDGGLLASDPAHDEVLRGVLGLVGEAGAAGSSGEDLAASWRRWLELPADAREEKARPVREVVDLLAESPTAGSFTDAGGPGGFDLRRAVEGGKVLLVNLSPGDGPTLSTLVFGTVFLRLFAEAFARTRGSWAASAPPSGFSLFVNGAERPPAGEARRLVLEGPLVGCRLLQ